AYAEDRYAKEGARIASCGADDNASGTAVLLLAAPILLEMSHQGRLGCDVWLVHLTGSEFPADALGARKLTEALVEDTLTLTGADGSTWDLRGAQVTGVFVADTIAHNSDHQPDVFQIAPGAGRGALELAALAHEAHAVWNASVPTWNKRADRHGKPRGRRSPYGNAMPETAAHLIVQGHVRLQTDPRSMLYRSDGQVFSDAGVPTVLITENVDVRRAGIHDSFDTMANIDLDYGAALAAIIIEAVARAAGGTEAASSSGT
ncbi:MAG: M28 family peptidase, partial [Gemmataceae bacterium]|nr:M28 family peptidase [Gemmataceae bacterium]